MREHMVAAHPAHPLASSYRLEFAVERIDRRLGCLVTLAIIVFFVGLAVVVALLVDA